MEDNDKMDQQDSNITKKRNKRPPGDESLTVSPMNIQGEDQTRKEKTNRRKSRKTDDKPEEDREGKKRGVYEEKRKARNDRQEKKEKERSRSGKISKTILHAGKSVELNFMGSTPPKIPRNVFVQEKEKGDNKELNNLVGSGIDVRSRTLLSKDENIQNPIPISGSSFILDKNQGSLTSPSREDISSSSFDNSELNLSVDEGINTQLSNMSNNYNNFDSSFNDNEKDKNTGTDPVIVNNNNTNNNNPLLSTEYLTLNQDKPIMDDQVLKSFLKSPIIINEKKVENKISDNTDALSKMNEVISFLNDALIAQGRLITTLTNNVTNASQSLSFLHESNNSIVQRLNQIEEHLHHQYGYIRLSQTKNLIGIQTLYKTIKHMARETTYTNYLSKLDLFSIDEEPRLNILPDTINDLISLKIEENSQFDKTKTSIRRMIEEVKKNNDLSMKEITDRLTAARIESDIQIKRLTEQRSGLYNPDTNNETQERRELVRPVDTDRKMEVDEENYPDEDEANQENSEGEDSGGITDELEKQKQRKYEERLQQDYERRQMEFDKERMERMRRLSQIQNPYKDEYNKEKKSSKKKNDVNLNQEDNMYNEYKKSILLEQLKTKAPIIRNRTIEESSNKNKEGNETTSTTDQKDKLNQAFKDNATVRDKEESPADRYKRLNELLGRKKQ